VAISECFRPWLIPSSNMRRRSCRSRITFDIAHFSFKRLIHLILSQHLSTSDLISSIPECYISFQLVLKVPKRNKDNIDLRYPISLLHLPTHSAYPLMPILADCSHPRESIILVNNPQNVIRERMQLSFLTSFFPITDILHHMIRTVANKIASSSGKYSRVCELPMYCT